MALPGPVEHLIALWSKFPGIGAKTARRLVFFMLQQRREWVQEMAQSLLLLHEKVGACSECGSLTDIDPCHICRNELRNRKIVVSKFIRLAIEEKLQRDFKPKQKQNRLELRKLKDLYPTIF